ncbi:group II intron reverse transcriptase/maturase [Halalkalibacter oceani]|uniref:RNA-directed DNA polymerase n=1 Tax=Halalkalibacter oceani TaxID=1653776 RepID=A0A9X2DTH0_9BACI|nr:group II intron reverse transcriptase/maturase [Halalkalibacter oceani]MCM3716699.1 group II intron reverse transcriptase/maturase [Halalkalibacter oceani]
MLDQILSRENLLQALKRVESNKGSPGIDGMTTESVRSYLMENWDSLRKEIMEGTYRPQPVRRVDIPKPSGGVRKLGIPTVVDRLIQQAIAQVLSKKVDATFSSNSYGFRPGKRGHDGVRKARGYVREGYGWVVDLDLLKFFDRVHHDRLMRRLSQVTQDKQVLRLIRRYLQAGIMEDGLVQPSTEGTPQGGPLSPLLSNIVLDEWDQELEKRGYRFVRYADDCQIYVKSRRAAKQTLEKMTTFVEEKLHLKVNREKSAWGRPWDRTFLGFTFTRHRKDPKIRISKESVRRCKDRIRHLTSRRQSIHMEERIRRLNRFITGWMGYYQLVETPSFLEKLDSWVRRRLRMIRWKEWKTTRTRQRKLVSLGASRGKAWEWANTRKAYWRVARSPILQKTLDSTYWKGQGLKSVLERYETLRQT